MDPQIIAIGIAISALSGVIATSNALTIWRLLAAMCFFISVIGSGALFAVLMATKAPLTMHQMVVGNTTGKKDTGRYLWLFKRWRALGRLGNKMSLAETLEFGYLTLYFGFSLFEYVIAFWIATSF